MKKINILFIVFLLPACSGGETSSGGGQGGLNLGALKPNISFVDSAIGEIQGYSFELPHLVSSLRSISTYDAMDINGVKVNCATDYQNIYLLDSYVNGGGYDRTFNCIIHELCHVINNSPNEDDAKSCEREKLKKISDLRKN